jgi:hypothetical protein
MVGDPIIASIITTTIATMHSSAIATTSTAAAAAAADHHHHHRDHRLPHHHHPCNAPTPNYMLPFLLDQELDRGSLAAPLISAQLLQLMGDRDQIYGAGDEAAAAAATAAATFNYGLFDMNVLQGSASTTTQRHELYDQYCYYPLRSSAAFPLQAAPTTDQGPADHQRHVGGADDHDHDDHDHDHGENGDGDSGDSYFADHTLHDDHVTYANDASCNIIDRPDHRFSYDHPARSMMIGAADSTSAAAGGSSADMDRHDHHHRRMIDQYHGSCNRILQQQQQQLDDADHADHDDADGGHDDAAAADDDGGDDDDDDDDDVDGDDDDHDALLQHLDDQYLLYPPSILSAAAAAAASSGDDNYMIMDRPELSVLISSAQPPDDQATAFNHPSNCDQHPPEGLELVVWSCSKH